mgnify:CR=1 FL=1
MVRVDRWRGDPFHEDAADLFLGKLDGVSDPEQKRKIIGGIFIDVFEEVAGRVGHFDFLAQRGGHFATTFVHGLTGQMQLVDLFSRHGLFFEDQSSEIVGERDEIFVLADEIGLAVDFDQNSGVLGGRGRRGDPTFGGHTTGFLVSLGQAFAAHVLGRGFDIAIGGGECLLALHHASAGALA